MRPRVLLPTGSGSISLIRCLLNDWGMLITPLRGSAYWQSIKRAALVANTATSWGLFTPHSLHLHLTCQIFRKAVSVSNTINLLDKVERKVKRLDRLNTSPLRYHYRRYISEKKIKIKKMVADPY